jgi:DNA-binding XRE family transcriptional regulator
MGVNLKRIKAYRIYNEYSQGDMADKMEISLTSYCHKEQGLKDFTSTEVGKMADIFGVPAGDLFSLEKQLL